MVELAIWYDQDAESDYAEGDPAILARTAAELDTLIDRVLAETRQHRCPAMIQVGINGNSGLPILEVGLGETKGFITYHAEDGGSTKGDGNPDRFVEYVYVGNLSEIRSDIEVSIEDVRRGLHEFMSTGRRPTVIR
ncbi:Imm1 family immunity protein [Actinokineospora sp.]|uniref:Imm1 family immunity protein n=1 Tax=Actinokineospora sp. TaxID=1872133 RepID=UPI004037A8EC